MIECVLFFHYYYIKLFDEDYVLISSEFIL